MNQLVSFVLGIAIGIGVGFAVWKQPDRALGEYARAEAVGEEATKITEAKVEPKKEEPPPKKERPPVVRTPIAVKQKKSPGLSPDQLVAAHWNANIDADWAEKSTDALRRDFERLESSHPFTVQSIDCRQTSCIAVLEWGRNTEAQSAQPELLGAPYGLVCSKRLIFPPGRSAEGYQTTLVFYDCQH